MAYNPDLSVMFLAFITILLEKKIGSAQAPEMVSEDNEKEVFEMAHVLVVTKETCPRLKSSS